MMYLGYHFCRCWDFLYIMPLMRLFDVGKFGGTSSGEFLSASGLSKYLMVYIFLLIKLLNHK